VPDNPHLILLSASEENSHKMLLWNVMSLYCF
jgi:hypothetical protein